MATGSSLSDSAAANFVCAMSMLIHDTELADFTVTCGDKTWKLHSTVLASRSPFFRAAFANNMMEKLEMKIDIKDLDPETMEEVVNYMYGKPMGNTPINFLFEAAERFQMWDLKKDVVTLAKQRMSSENVVEFAELAEMYDAGELLKECVDFIVENDIYLKEDLSENLTKMVFSILSENLKEAKLKHKLAKYVTIPARYIANNLVYDCIVHGCNVTLESKASVVKHLIKDH